MSQTIQSPTVSRRRFLAGSSAAVAACVAAPAVITANKSDSRTIIGEGDYRYEVMHEWPQLPKKFQWQTTHNVAVDKAGNLYVIHEGRNHFKDHPSIFVFDEQGKYVLSFGTELQGGGHGIEIREEDGQEFVYVCGYQMIKALGKYDLKGERVWWKHAPMESGVYADGEASNPQKVWGRNRFLPTNFAFLDDGDFLLVDGYGSFYVHQYNRDGKWKRHFGGPGHGQGKFKTPHGIWIDRREGREPSIVIADRAHHTLQYLTMDGKYMETLEGYGWPANMDTWKNLMVVPELFARVTLLNEKNEVVARLGSDIERIKGDAKRTIRRTASKWIDGRFIHPHDACFDGQGNIYVAEWVGTGRVSKLKWLNA